MPSITGNSSSGDNSTSSSSEPKPPELPPRDFAKNKKSKITGGRHVLPQAIRSLVGNNKSTDKNNSKSRSPPDSSSPSAEDKRRQEIEYGQYHSLVSNCIISYQSVYLSTKNLSSRTVSHRNHFFSHASQEPFLVFPVVLFPWSSLACHALKINVYLISFSFCCRLRFWLFILLTVITFFHCDLLLICDLLLPPVFIISFVSHDLCSGCHYLLLIPYHDMNRRSLLLRTPGSSTELWRTKQEVYCVCCAIIFICRHSLQGVL